MPIPTKPFFFDIASNGIELPLANIERRAAGKTRLPIERPVHRDEEKVATSAAATTVAPAESKSAGGGIVNWLWGK